MMGVLNREEGISEREKVGAFIPGNRVPAKTGQSRLALIDALDCGSHRSRQGTSAPQHQGIDNHIDLEVIA